MASTLTSAQLATAKQLAGYLTAPPAALKLVGLPLNSADGFLGNVAQECSFDPTLSGDAGASKFWCQWQGVRLTNYEAWCAANNLAPTSTEAICYVLVELPTSNGAPTIVPWLYDTSNGGQPSRSIATLTEDICTYFERAGTPDLPDRIAYANQIAAYMAIQGTSPGASSVPVTPAAPATPSTPAAPAAPVPAPTTAATLDPNILAAIVSLVEAREAGFVRGLSSLFAAASPATVASTISPAAPTAASIATELAALLPSATAATTPTINLGSIAADLTPLLTSSINSTLPGLVASAVSTALPALMPGIAAELAKMFVPATTK